MAKHKTFTDIYKLAGQEPSPRERLVKRIALVTKKSEATVKQWGKGAQVPDALTCCVLEKELGIKAEILFPSIKKKKHLANEK